MDALTTKAAAGIAYATASHAKIFVSVGLAFVGLGLALVLMLRPRTSMFCIWSLGLFSLAWLIESTTHLLGLGGHASVQSLQYGVWTAVALFGLGLVIGVLGVLAYMRNEHKYDRGLTVGVLATMLNLWGVGGIVTTLKNHRMGELGRGLVMPMMPTGGPVDQEALIAHLKKMPQREESEATQKMRAILGMAFRDLTSVLAGDEKQGWEFQPPSANEDPAQVLKDHPCGSPEVLRALHGEAQYVFTLSREPAWMSLQLARMPDGQDLAGEWDAKGEHALREHLLTLTPARRHRTARQHWAGFEVVRVTTRASISGLAGEVTLDRWTAAAGQTVVRVMACATEETPAFQSATREMVTGLLRKLQRDGLAGAAWSEARQQPYTQALALEAGKKHTEALAAWQKITGAEPGEPEAFLGVLREYWNLGQPKRALAWLESGAKPNPHSVAAVVADLRIRAANGQPDARASLLQRFSAGLADDEALAGVLAGFAAARDRAGALEVLAAHGKNHGDPVVAWWQGFLNPSPPPAATAPLAPVQAAQPAAAAPTRANSPPARRSRPKNATGGSR